MEIGSAKCECCGLREDCTNIRSVKADFGGMWLCGLCSESVKDEAGKAGMGEIEDAVRAHMSFCGKLNSNPAIRVAEGMRQLSKSTSSRKLGRSFNS
jgi:Protein of unknown function (DUF1677)